MPEDPGVSVTLGGDVVQARPFTGDVEELRLTIPAKALTEEMVMVDVAAEPALVATLVWLAVIEKSGTLMLYVTVAV